MEMTQANGSREVYPAAILTYPEDKRKSLKHP
jgi:hypothetical protein